MMDLPFEQFPALSAIGICRHVFTQRIPGINVSDAKAEVLNRLDAAHREIRNTGGMGDWPMVTPQQVHGNKIAVVREVGSALRADREWSELDWHAGAVSRSLFTSLTVAQFTVSIQNRRRLVFCTRGAKAQSSESSPMQLHR